MIDQVDDADRVVGQIPRGQALVAGANFRTVHVLVTSGSCVLVQQLAPARDRHPLRWGSSSAAYLHRGESYAEGAYHRLREELGLVLELRWVGVAPMQDERSLKFVGLFLAQLPVGLEPTINEPAHISALRFVPFPELFAQSERPDARLTPTLRHLLSFFGPSRLERLPE